MDNTDAKIPAWWLVPIALVAIMAYQWGMVNLKVQPLDFTPLLKGE